MNSQKAWGTLFTLIGLAGLVYCIMGLMDYGIARNSLIGIIMVTSVFLVRGLVMLKNSAEKITAR